MPAYYRGCHAILFCFDPRKFLRVTSIPKIGDIHSTYATSRRSSII
jgi:GTPase SAR1 family protein